ncbi:aminotransferase A [Heyndrickxia acidicola]|uniref:Aminotransferase n=1 Tax=Heyndrickxia acidicola TaxID=209389 RepID=A0ABU6MHW3_9BACI|nr:aminotransferase A [Heyndrickxia acidicola]MED1204263.1 aminotransferase A [Heyndrickxia acidicola]
MEHLVNPRVKKIEISGIRKFFNMVSHVEDMISFTIGQPDFPTPEHVKRAGIKAIEEDYTIYTHNAGMLELREAAAQFMKTKYAVEYDPSSEILITTGASEAIDVSLRAILSEDLEVLLPGPVYPGYEPIIQLCGAKPVHIDTRDSNFKLTAAKLKNYVTEKTRCIILPYPSNPTGVSLSEQELREIAELVKGKDIFIIADEIYSELVYSGKHVSIASMLKEQTILINGLSKSHSMTGWRIGMLFAPENIAKHILKVHQYNVSCASSISQKAALEALTEGINDADGMREEYTKRREYVAKRLKEMDVQFVYPDGAFYFFVKLPENANMSSFDFALELAHKAKVAVIPGSAFSEFGEGYFRLSYACSQEKLEIGLNRMETFIKQLKTE